MTPHIFYISVVVYLGMSIVTIYLFLLWNSLDTKNKPFTNKSVAYFAISWPVTIALIIAFSAHYVMMTLAYKWVNRDKLRIQRLDERIAKIEEDRINKNQFNQNDKR